MSLLALFLRREPTTDETTRRLDPETKKMDVVAYRDEAMTIPAVRYPWFSSRLPRKDCRRVMFNCYQWRAVWRA